MKSIKIGGVNEHFNFPWRNAVSLGKFKERGVDLIWEDIAGGTGEMIRLLDNNKLDLAVLLTEGIFQHIIRNKTVSFLQFHTLSPLHWGIHVRKEDEKLPVPEIWKKRFAISRMGSGSHLMAKVKALQIHQTITDDQFIVVNSLEGGLKALKENKADVFLWEKYTTEPFLSEYNLIRIGDVPTPWPGFCVVANKSVLVDHKNEIQAIMNTICNMNRQLHSDNNTSALIAGKYNLREEKTRQWLSETQWNTEPGSSPTQIHQILHDLCIAGIINRQEAETPYNELVFNPDF